MKVSPLSLNHYTPLRKYFHEQSKLCPYLTPAYANASISIKEFIAKKSQVPTKLYMTSYWIQAFSRALKNHPRVNSSFVRSGLILRRPQILSFDSVDAAVSIDKTVGNDRFPFTYILPHSDQLSLLEINEHLDYAIRSPVENVPQFKQFLSFLRFPSMVQKILMLQTTLSAEKMKKRVGTFNLTNVSRWGFLQTHAPCPRLLVAINRIQGNCLNISYSFNHLIVDGAQIGEYHSEVKDIVENFKFN